MAGAEPRRLPLLLLLVFPSSPVGAALRLLLGAAPPFTCSQPVSAAAARGALGARWRRPAGRQAAGPGKGTGLAASPAVRAAGRARRRGRGGKEGGGGPASSGVSGRRRQLPAGVPRGGGSPTGGRGPDRGEERPGSRGEGAASPVEGLRGSGGRQRDLALPGKGLSGGGRGAPGRGPEPGPVPLPSERGAARALGRTPGSSKGSGPDAPEPPHPQQRPRGRRRPRRAELGAGELALPRGAELVASAGAEPGSGGNRPGRQRGGGGGDRGRVSCPPRPPASAPLRALAGLAGPLWSCCWPHILVSRCPAQLRPGAWFCRVWGLGCG